jgi:hypothetical protein
MGNMMRDLLFKNFTSSDKKRKVISSSEIMDQEGVRSIIRRHFICLVKEVENKETVKPLPYLYVLKSRNTKEHKEQFFCRIKGSVYALSGEKLYLFLFMHSLKINLVSPTQQNV